jgi:hypothetical protein
MMAHVEGLGDALAHGSPWAAWTLTPAQVVAQDVGWRLLQVAADCDGEAATLLDDLAQRLASDAESLPGVIETYEVACDDWWLPSAAEVFALGYALPRGHGRSTEGLARALGDAMPGTEALLDESLPAHLVAFAQEPPTRGPLPRRLAAWLAAGTPGPVAEVARYEAACADPQPADEATDSLGEGEGEPIAASGIEVLEFTVDPTLLLQALEDESVAEDDAERPTILAIRQRAGGEVVVAEINAAAAAFLVGTGPGPHCRSMSRRRSPSSGSPGRVAGPHEAQSRATARWSGRHDGTRHRRATPPSPHTGQLHWISSGRSCRRTRKKPAQGRCSGRRRHGTEVVTVTPACSARAATTMWARWRSRGVAGSGLTRSRSTTGRAFIAFPPYLLIPVHTGPNPGDPRNFLDSLMISLVQPDFGDPHGPHPGG